MVHQKDRGEDPNQANKVGQREVELSPLRDQYWGQGQLQRNDCRIVSHQSWGRWEAKGATGEGPWEHHALCQGGQSLYGAHPKSAVFYFLILLFMFSNIYKCKYCNKPLWTTPPTSTMISAGSVLFHLHSPNPLNLPPPLDNFKVNPRHGIISPAKAFKICHGQICVLAGLLI